MGPPDLSVLGITTTPSPLSGTQGSEVGLGTLEVVLSDPEQVLGCRAAQ